MRNGIKSMPAGRSLTTSAMSLPVIAPVVSPICLLLSSASANAPLLSLRWWAIGSLAVGRRATERGVRNPSVDILDRLAHVLDAKTAEFFEALSAGARQRGLPRGRRQRGS